MAKRAMVREGPWSQEKGVDDIMSNQPHAFSLLLKPSCFCFSFLSLSSPRPPSPCFLFYIGYEDRSEITAPWVPAAGI